MQAPAVSVLVVDDHPALRAGLEQLLDQEPGYRLLGTVSSEAELAVALERERPDVVVMDYVLTHGDGLSACFRLKQRPQPRGVVLYSAYVDEVFAVPAALAQADAIVSKNDPVEVLLRLSTRSPPGPRGCRRPTRSSSRRPRPGWAPMICRSSACCSRGSGWMTSRRPSAWSRERYGHARSASSARCRRRIAEPSRPDRRMGCASRASTRRNAWRTSRLPASLSARTTPSPRPRPGGRRTTSSTTAAAISSRLPDRERGARAAAIGRSPGGGDRPHASGLHQSRARARRRRGCGRRDPRADREIAHDLGVTSGFAVRPYSRWTRSAVTWAPISTPGIPAPGCVPPPTW